MTRFEERKVGPDEARAYLDANYSGNRRVRASWVRQLAKMMADGDFMPQNGETIIVDEHGTLYNGQHRMRAVVESGVELVFDFAVLDASVAEAAYMTMDNTTKRQAADFVEGGNKNARAALAKIACCIEHGNTPLLSSIQGKYDAQTIAPRTLITGYANGHADEIGECVAIGARIRRVMNAGSVSAYGTAAFLIKRYGDPSMLGEFVDEVCDVFTSDRTARAYMEAVRNAYMRNGSVTPKWLIGTTLDAYEHFAAMDGSTTLNKAAARVKQYDRLVAQAREEAAA